MNEMNEQIFDQLVFIYGKDVAVPLAKRITEILQLFREQHPSLAASSPYNRVSERDIILITYGDMVREEWAPPLGTLADFLNKYLAGIISTIHILPFYPYSSDDGFAIIDYRRVNSKLGTWDDIAKIGENFRVMFDAVINHISSQSAWFQGFLRDEPDTRDYFTVVESGTDLSQVFRPRATPVLTAFNTLAGQRFVWTTFSADQIDLNFRNPELLLEVINILLFYIAHGAEFIRLDAVTFIWKEPGTDCINLPRTHRIIQLMRTLLDIVAPCVTIITETNVPHKDNIAYFGDGKNEAQMVYNFALPLLTLHAFLKENVTILSKWAETLELPSEQATYFNFLAGHDGIGVLPVKNILSLSDLNEIVARTQSLGGFVSYKSNSDGSKSPYELNINFLDALSDPDEYKQSVEHLDELSITSLDALSDPETPESDVEFLARRFLATQAIMLAIRGVPGIYFHSLFGSRNWLDGVKQTGRNRTINREKLPLDQLERELADPDSLRSHVFGGYCKLLAVRTGNYAFHPCGGQNILTVHPSIFTVLRTSKDGLSQVLCCHNVSTRTHQISVELDSFIPTEVHLVTDLLSQREFQYKNGKLQISFAPYQVLWLRL